MTWFSKRRGSTVYDEPKERRETITKDVCRHYTEYRVEITYNDGETQTEHATSYTRHNNHIELYDERMYLTTYVSWSSDEPSSEEPRFYWEDGGPLIISLADVRSIDISKNGDFVDVVEDVEYTQVYRQYEEGGDWEKSHTEVNRDLDAEDFDITTWFKNEWVSENE